jgi:trehalose 6-phosphate synthase
VAKEGPAVNRRDATLVLSRNAGAFGQLGAEAIPVDPVDVSGTADALHAALSMSEEDRKARARRLRAAASRGTPADWVARQLKDLAPGDPGG